MLAAVRDAIYQISMGHQSYSVNGDTYTRADLDKLRILERQLCTRVGAAASGSAGGVRTAQIVF